ncbi:hypothetical protein [Luteimonas abyssi]|uniref:hypothetical protein n=1 Tax=Luteimonas abyssi TaxID=1247514 RepID=UPI000A8F0E61|nr:hypothetical protein [Luteimonas abyssi]
MSCRSVPALSRRPVSALAAALALVLIPTLAHAAPPTLTDLGAHHYVQDVSDDGAVAVGLFDDRDTGTIGVSRWTETGGTDVIGGLGRNPGAGSPAVSADGSRIAATVSGDVTTAAFWSEAEGWQPIDGLGFLPPYPGWGTYANAISADGQRLAGGTIAAPVTLGRMRAFSYNPDDWQDRWSDFGWQELPLLRKGSFSEATAISNDGTVQAGRSTTGISSAFRAVMWKDGRVSELPGYGDDHLGGESVACNGDCSVIVGGGGGNSAFAPVLAWRYRPADVRRPACHLQPHADAPRDALRYYARSTSEDGNVIVGSYHYNQVSDDGWIRNLSKGFIWIGDATGGTMHDLQGYLTRLGQPGLAGWQDLNATGLSADARYLVGWGVDAAGTPRGWRVDFGGAPRATGGAEDRTRCPTSLKPPHAHLASAPAAEADDFRETPEGRFGDGAGTEYVLRNDGMRLTGAMAGRNETTELLPLGGGRYLTPGQGVLTVTHDTRGLVTGIESLRPDGGRRRLERIAD